jgi:two-component system response regulator AlgR
MKYLVVDDEHLARTRLHEMVHQIDSSIEVIEAANGEEAIKHFEQHNPRLVLLDISMPGIGGMELAYHLSAVDYPPSVIFTTAHNEYALQAFDANSIDYLLKPIQKERLQIALNKAEPLTNRQNRVLAVGENQRTHIAVKEKGKLKLINLKDIAFFRADNKYVVVTTEKGEYLLNETLNQLENDLGEDFIRAHRNSLISKNFIEGIEKVGFDKWQVFFRNFEETLEVSRRQKPVIRNWLRNKN